MEQSHAMKKHLGLGPLRWLVVFVLVLVAPHARAEPSDLGAILGAIEDPYPLRAADTSSPRDTLRTFVRDFTEAINAWQSEKPEADIIRPVYRAGKTIDFGELRYVNRRADVVIKMALLKEILDRVELPPYEQIPGDNEVSKEGIERWTIPNTQIEIARIEEGANAGRFLFTNETVTNLKTYYELAKDLPYSKGASVGLYKELIESPGYWFPKNIPDNFPEWANEIVVGQALWQWIALFILMVIAGFLIWFVYRLGATWDEKHTRARPSLRFGVPLALLAAFAIAYFVGVASFRGIGLYEIPYTVVSYITLTVKIGSLASLVLVISGRLADGFAFSQEGSAEKRRVDAALLRIVFRLVSVVILAYLGIYAAEQVGIPIAPLIAGLGVGGLAIALAIRPTLENIIGGLTLFADRPVRVGDFCRYGDQIGTVEEIGLRSTRIRSLERTIVTVPNAEFSQMQLDNFAVRDTRLLKTILQLRYETTPEQMRFILVKLRELLLGHPMVTPEPARVRLVAYGAYSKDLEIFAYLRCRDQGDFLAIQEDLLLRMEDIINAAGSGFAFPSQTAYLSRDTGLDTERGNQAEVEVQHLRVKGKLPFPDFDEEERERLEDIIDYPPKGSPNHQPR
jgi:MscS family membrane protein